MPAYDLPRPPATSAAAYFSLVVGFGGLLRGMWLANSMFYEEKAGLSLPYVFLFPTLVLALVYFFFQGKNAARIAFWVLGAGAVGYSVYTLPFSLTYFYVFMYLLIGGLLAHPNSHWYFTGRDFRRRLGHRLAQQRRREEMQQGRSRKFEY